MQGLLGQKMTNTKDDKEKETNPLPQKPWKVLEGYVRSIGENEKPDSVADDEKFFRGIGLLNSFGKLTEKGRSYFEEKFIKGNHSEAKRVLGFCLLDYPPVEAITQYLWGVKAATAESVLTILKANGFWYYSGTAPLTHLLELLNEVRIIRYDRRNKKIVVLKNPGSQSPPRNIFIDSSKPYSNVVWIKRVLSECDEFIYWIDKHFQKEALEWIWEVADASRMKEIKIMSLDTGENLNKKAKDEYRRLKKELSLKRIDLTWYTIDSREIRDMHDRWILGKDYARNVPNVNAILSGQRAELSRSDNFDEIFKAFKEYLQKASPIVI